MKTFVSIDEKNSKHHQTQFATFTIDEKLYGINVMRVQEITKLLQVSPMRSAPPFIKGLINLRGQIATAIGLRDLFDLGTQNDKESMTIVCKVEDVLLSLLVDSIGDVIEVSEKEFEPIPQTIKGTVKNYLKGVYKTSGGILSEICLDSILKDLELKCAG